MTPDYPVYYQIETGAINQDGLWTAFIRIDRYKTYYFGPHTHWRFESENEAVAYANRLLTVRSDSPDSQLNQTPGLFQSTEPWFRLNDWIETGPAHD